MIISGLVEKRRRRERCSCHLSVARRYHIHEIVFSCNPYSLSHIFDRHLVNKGRTGVSASAGNASKQRFSNGICFILSSRLMHESCSQEADRTHMEGNQWLTYLIVCCPPASQLRLGLLGPIFPAPSRCLVHC